MIGRGVSPSVILWVRVSILLSCGSAGEWSLEQLFQGLGKVTECP